MAINKKLIHFNSKENFMSAENGVNNSPETPTGENGAYGQIKGTSIVFIKDSKEIWTHGNLYKSVNWSVLSGPVENRGTLSIVSASGYGDDSVSMFQITLTFEYPVATDITIDFSGLGVDAADAFVGYSLTLPKGETTISETTPTIYAISSIDSITPEEDSDYKYLVTIS